jgi:hypothetical protein
MAKKKKAAKKSAPKKAARKAPKKAAPKKAAKKKAAPKPAGKILPRPFVTLEDIRVFDGNCPNGCEELVFCKKNGQQGTYKCCECDPLGN